MTARYSDLVDLTAGNLLQLGAGDDTNFPKELLRFASAWRIIIYCIIVLLIINYRPNGIFGDWEISRLWKKRKPAGETKA